MNREILLMTLKGLHKHFGVVVTERKKLLWEDKRYKRPAAEAALQHATYEGLKKSPVLASSSSMLRNILVAAFFIGSGKSDQSNQSSYFIKK